MAHRPRSCRLCGQGYFRCNRLHLWIGQPKAGAFRLLDEPVCLRCMPEPAVRRLVVATGIHVTVARRRRRAA